MSSAKLAFPLFCCLAILTGCVRPFSGRQQPVAHKGELDLSSWNFEKDGPVQLKGEWEFYWKKFSKDIRPDTTPNFIHPGPWNSFKREGKEIGGEGYGTYRLRIKLPPGGGQKLGFRGSLRIGAVTSIGEATYFTGKPGRSKVETTPISRIEIFEIEKSSNSGPVTITIESSNFFHHNGG
ncbi:MAG: hypothetical protein KDK33_16420, partial [Leptospiraceae bacterium]|nr:hypothetical protein [Leptospiraceae bacterium]